MTFAFYFVGINHTHAVSFHSDPALLSNGSPVKVTWNIPLGEPTPDPALLPNNGSPVKITWNIPLGEPTPDPALLPNNGSPVKLTWNIPLGEPTPDQHYYRIMDHL